MTDIPSTFGGAINEYLGAKDGRWVPNWPLTEPRLLGDEGRVSNGGFARRRPSDLPILPLPSPVAEPAWQYMSSRNMSIDAAASAQADGQVGGVPVGNAKAAFTLHCDRAGSVYVAATDVHIESATDISAVTDALRKLGEDHAVEVGTAIVIERLAADAATVVTARSDNASVGLSVSADVSAFDGTPASAAGKLKMTTADALASIDSPVGEVTIAMRVAVLVKRGWLWWRHTHVETLTASTPAEQLAFAEAHASDDDYLVMFDTAGD